MLIGRLQPARTEVLSVCPVLEANQIRIRRSKEGSI